MAESWHDHSFMLLAYRDSPFLEGCLRTLRAQTLPSRIVVATSTPSPFIERAVRAAGAEIRVNPQRQGIGADWNFALDAAPTRYVTLAHQDDVYDPAFTARTRAAFSGNPDGALCFTGYREIADDGTPRRSKVSVVKGLIGAATIGRRARVDGWRRRLFLSFGNPLPCSSVTFDMAGLGGFRFSADYASNLDWDAWWRLHGEGRVFLHCPEPLVGRRHNPLTETAQLIRNGTRRQEDLSMFRRIWPAGLGSLIAALYRTGYYSGRP